MSHLLLLWQKAVGIEFDIPLSVNATDDMVPVVTVDVSLVSVISAISSFSFIYLTFFIIQLF